MIVLSRRSQGLQQHVQQCLLRALTPPVQQRLLGALTPPDAGNYAPLKARLAPTGFTTCHATSLWNGAFQVSSDKNAKRAGLTETIHNARIPHLVNAVRHTSGASCRRARRSWMSVGLSCHCWNSDLALFSQQFAWNWKLLVVAGLGVFLGDIRFQSINSQCKLCSIITLLTLMPLQMPHGCCIVLPICLPPRWMGHPGWAIGGCWH